MFASLEGGGVMENEEDIPEQSDAGGGEIIKLPMYRSGRHFIENLVKNGATSDQIDNLLFMNTQKGDLNGVMACLENGANVNFEYGEKKETSAFVALKIRRRDLFEYLVDNGAKLDGPIVRICCETNQIEILKYLQSVGVDISTIGVDKHSPATYAAIAGHVECLKFLHSIGQDLLKTDFDGSPPAFAAARFGQLECLKYLTELGADLDHRRPDGTTATFAAAEFGRIDCLQFLIESGADFNLSKDNGVSPAFIATSNNEVGSLKLLAEAGIDLEQESNTFTLPIVATGKGSLDCLKFLIEAGVDIDRGAGDRESTAVHCAAQLGRIDSMMVLAAYGADLGIPKRGGITPAHVAASYGQLEILEFLAQRREDLFAKDSMGRTPIFLASSKQHMKCVVFLQRQLNDMMIARQAEINFIHSTGKGDILPDD